MQKKENYTDFGNWRKKRLRWIDMHCDTISELQNRKEETLFKNRLCVDGERLGQSGGMQFFACFVYAPYFGEVTKEGEVWDKAYESVLNMLDYAHRGDGEPVFVTTKKQIEEVTKVKGILTVEEGGVLNGCIDRLDTLYERGVRLMTLTWNYRNCIGSPNSREMDVMERGLEPFGREVVGRMNELGMMIDVSHLSDGGFWDCIRESRFPVVASHSNARSLCDHPRNLSDGMLHALGEKGGVAGVNFYSAFLTGNEKAGIDDIVRHILYMIDKAGEDAVALGTDLDGFEYRHMPEGIRDVRDIDRLILPLEKSGLTGRQIEKFLKGNVMRVIGDVWK